LPGTERQTAAGDYRVSDDRSLLDFDTIHEFLARSYWSPGIPRSVVERAAAHSTPFGLYHIADPDRCRQVGYVRVLSDFSAFAYLMDVFILEPFRGLGLGQWMVDAAMADERFGDVRTWLLITRDAHGLYRKLGFSEVEPGRYMRRNFVPDWLATPGLQGN
jgi:GNAT superfamily N-acetyltransferase